MSQGNAGRLHVGQVQYTKGVFVVEFLFESTSGPIGPRQMKSASATAAQTFFRLLHENGFGRHGEPETRMGPTSKGSDRLVKFWIAAPAERGKAKIITIKEPPYGDALTGMKLNGNGGG